VDVATIDQEFGQLQQEANLVAQTIEAFAGKLQAAGDGGDANAKGWLLDLKGIALQIQQEQLQVQSLLQALHDFTVNSTAAAPGYAAAPQAAPAPQAQLVQPEEQPQQKTGFLSHFTGGGFGQAMATGAGMGVGFGVTESVINDIFN
jgi:hypothetical protein